MPRPEIIRADTLDLQASEHPSAKDHTQQPSHPSPLGQGPAALHQHHSLQHVQEERRVEQEHLVDALGSGRSSHEGSDLLNDEPRMSTESFNNHNDSDPRLDPAAQQQNGGDDSDVVDGEEVEDGDEDIDDKISSSPSISDGVYICFPSTSRDPDALLINRHQQQQPIPFSLESLASGEFPGIALAGEESTARIPSVIAHRQVSDLEHRGIGLPSVAHVAAELQASERHIESDESASSSSEVGAVENTSGKIYSSATHGFCFTPNVYPDHSDTIFEPEPRPTFSYGPTLLELNLMDSQEDIAHSLIGLAITTDDEDDSQPENDQELQDDDVDVDDCFMPDSRFIDSGFGGESLRDLEDIDFEFVYALHTFVATVEGQANATKGDTMVLLDDTNSYWWLVRIVKDNTIGYLPAEHIETPTERLARLNKHRNIDLSASMLGDSPEKSKNPLKKAMRRRNAKMVQFAPPTFYPSSDVDWSDTDPDREDGMDEDEMQEGEVNGHLDSEDTGKADEATLTNGHADSSDEDKIMKVSAKDQTKSMNGEASRTESKASSDAESSLSDPELDSKEMTSGRSRNGTIRNTDSFFKDDSAEPKKISLTPNLLREESTDSSGRSSESKDKLMQDIFDQIEAETNSGEKNRDRKKKEKKSNMLSGLFKRKDKKIKVDEAVGVVNKVGDDDSSGSPDDSGRNSPTTPSSPTTIPPTQPLTVRRPSGSGKLTKAPPPGLITSKGSLSSKSSAEKSPMSPQQSSDSLFAAASAESNASAGPPNATKSSTNTMPGGFPVTPEPTPPNEIQRRLGSPPPSEKQRDAGVLSPLTSLLTNNSSSEPKKERLKKAKERIELDVDSSPEAENLSYNPFHDPAFRDNVTADMTDYNDTRSLSQAVEDLQDGSPVSPVDASMSAASFPRPGASTAKSASSGYTNQTIPSASPPAAVDSQGDTVRDAGYEPKSSTETSYRSERARADSNMTTASSVTTTTPTPATPPPHDPSGWNDRALRMWVNSESNSEVKDLLILVHDDTGVEPLPQDHPTMIGLGFHQQHKQLNDMSSQLDSLLNGFLARRVASRPRATTNPTTTTATTTTKSTPIGVQR